MRYFFVCILIIFSQNIFSQSYFEGIIKYSVQKEGEYEFIHECDSIILYIKNDSVRLDQCLKGRIALLLGENYTKTIGWADSLHYTIADSAKIIRQLIPDSYEASTPPYIKKRQKDIIKGHDCVLYQFNELPHEFFWVDESYKINVNSFKMLSFRNIGLVIKQEIYSTGKKNGKLTITIKEIIPQKLSSDIFKLPDYPIKRMKVPASTQEFEQKYIKKKKKN